MVFMDDRAFPAEAFSNSHYFILNIRPLQIANFTSAFPVAFVLCVCTSKGTVNIGSCFCSLGRGEVSNRPRAASKILLNCFIDTRARTVKFYFLSADNYSGEPL